MKNISKKIFPILALAISTGIYAEYMVKIQLDPQGINIDLPSEIAGTAQLTPSTINRGESSTISWSYDYANEVEIEGLGKYGKTGSVNVASLASRIYKINATYGALSKTENLSLTVIQPNSNISFTSSSNRIGIGQPVILNWNVANARNINIDNGVGTDLPLISSSEVYPTADTTFTLAGFDYSDNSIISSLFVDVVENSVINSFNASTLNITKGNDITFNWDVTDSEGLNLTPYGQVSGTPTGSQSINFNTAGAFNFSLESTSVNGTVVSSTPIEINVYNPTIISSYTINSVDTSSDVSPSDPLNFEWTASDAVNYKLNGVSIGGTTTSLVAASTTGKTTYVLEAFNGAGDSVSESLSINVVGLPVVDSFTGASTVFANSPLTLSWTGTGVSKYEIKSNNNSSGINTAASDLGSSLTTNATPTVAGSYTYTLSGYNTANAKVDSTKAVVVEADPTFTGYTVNGQTSVSVSPSTALTYAGAGFSTGATLQGRNSTNTANISNTTTAPVTAGTYTYYASATKTLNSIARNSTARSVSVTVVDAPTIGTINSPTIVFANGAFDMTWSGSNVVNYKIRGDFVDSGVSTSDVDLGTTASRSITPTAAGTYTYTITATNAASVTTTSTKIVTVESDPTFTGFTVNGLTSISVAPSTVLTYAGAGFSAGATLQGRNSGNTSNLSNTTTAPVTAGTYTYYASATKTLNSIARNSNARSVSVTVVDSPTIGTVNSPTNVFANGAFDMTWSGSNVVNYKIRGNVATSGVSTSDVDLGTTASRSITPTAAGTYTYTITATNAASVTTTSTRIVTVEADPTFTGYTVNGLTTISVSPNAALAYAGAGFSTGATLQGRNSTNTANISNTTTAPVTAGTYTYYASATKSLNAIVRNSTARSVSVTVVDAPTIGTITAPTNVFSNAAFSMTWSGTNVVNYKIRGNVATSGISTSDVDLGTTASRSITPTAAGTYTYTITATNSIGVTTTSIKNVIVESDPTISDPRINSSSAPNVMPWAGISASATLSSGATLVSNVPGSAPGDVGPYTYTYRATKNLNGVTRDSVNITLNLEVGHVYSILVGRYSNNPYGMGYLAPETGWPVQNAGSMSNYYYKGVPFFAVYTTTDAPSNHFFVHFSNATNGLFDNKQIRINGALCSQSIQYYDVYGFIDSYQYHSCTSNLTNLTGSTVKFYISN